MAVTKTKSPTKVVTGEVRLSYAHIFEPYSNDPDDDPKYSCVILIPKKDKATIKKIRAAQQAALEIGKAKKFDGSIPKNWVDTLHDGDEEADLEKNPEYEDHWYMSVSSFADRKPGVVDADVQPILDASEVYSGCYARVAINAYPFAYKGKKGISFGLQHVQKTKDGVPFGNVSRAEDDFDEWESDEDDDTEGLI